MNGPGPLLSAWSQPSGPSEFVFCFAQPLWPPPVPPPGMWPPGYWEALPFLEKGSTDFSGQLLTFCPLSWAEKCLISVGFCKKPSALSPIPMRRQMPLIPESLSPAPSLIYQYSFEKFDFNSYLESGTWEFSLFDISLPCIKFLLDFSLLVISLFDLFISAQSSVLSRNCYYIFFILSPLEHGTQPMSVEVLNQCWKVWRNESYTSLLIWHFPLFLHKLMPTVISASFLN